MADETPDTTPAAPAETVESAPSTAPPEATRLGLPDGPAAQPGKPLTNGGQGEVTIRTRWPVDSFEHGIKGVPAITAHGVKVDRSKAKTLNEKATASGIELEEVSD